MNYEGFENSATDIIQREYYQWGRFAKHYLPTVDSLSTTESSKSKEGSQIVFQVCCKIERQSQGLKILRKITCSEKIPEFVKLLNNDIFFWRNIQNELNCNIAALRNLALKPHLVTGRLHLNILTGLKTFVPGKHKKKKVLITLKIKFHCMQWIWWRKITCINELWYIPWSCCCNSQY